MNRKDLLKQAKASIDALVASKKEAQTEDAEDTEAIKLALLLESNEEIAEAIRSQSFPTEAFAEAVRNAVSAIDIKVPAIDSPEVTVNVPDIKMPEFPAYPAFPEIKIPDIHVPEPKVTVNIPEIKLPTINVPETVINFPDKMDVGLSKFTLKSPMPVMQVDPQGNYVSPIAGGSGGPRRVKIDNDSSEPIPISGTISATFSADFGSGEVGSETLRTVQATDAIASVYVTGANGTIGVVTINPDGTPVYGGGAAGGGLTDAELRASHIDVVQMSGTIDSVYVTGVAASIYAEILNPDGRVKVELPTGSSGLTDTELRASHLDVQQVSGAIDSVNVIGTVPVSVANTLDVQQVSGANWSINVLSMPAVVVTSITNSVATSILNGDGTTLDPRNRNWTITETVPISSANTLDVKQVSGASDSVNVLSMPAIVVTSITNSTASALVDSSGIQYSGSNPVPVTWVSGAGVSTAVHISDSTGVGYSGSNPLPVTGTVVVSSITASTASALVDSTGVQYSGSNPAPVYDGPRSTSPFAPTNATSTAYERNRVAKASAGILYGISGYNSSTAAQFIHIHNASSQPADGVAPVIVIRVTGSGNFSYDPGRLGRFFSTGITVSNSTTGATKTVGYADCWFDIQYG